MGISWLTAFDYGKGTTFWGNGLRLDEYDSLRSQIAILKNHRGHHRKYLPYVFTEQGAAMLSAVLRSETAIKVSIQIMQAFVQMRKVLTQNATLFQRLDNAGELKEAHDRFLILDNGTIYHFGDSLKDLGQKWFAFSKMESASLSILDKTAEMNK